MLSKSGSSAFPAVVSFADDGVRTGTEAVAQASENYSTTIVGASELLGVRVDSVPEWVECLPVRLVAVNDSRERLPGDRSHPYRDALAAPTDQESPRVRAAFDVHGTPTSFVEAIAYQFAEIREAAQVKFGEPILDVVVAVPASFRRFQLAAIEHAAMLAGLRPRRLMPASSAASLSLLARARKEVSTAVVLAGGLGCEVCVAFGAQGVVQVSWSAFLTSSFSDLALVRDLCAQSKRLTKARYGLDCEADGSARLRLLLQALAQLDAVVAEGGACIDMGKVIHEGGSRVLPIDCLRPRIDREASTLVEALTAARQGDDPGTVVIAGRWTACTDLAEELGNRLGVRIRTLERDIGQTAVVQGAALQGAILSGDTADLTLLDSTRHSLGIGTAGGATRVLIGKDATIPTRASTEIRPAASEQTIALQVVEGESTSTRKNVEVCRSRIEITPRCDVSVTLDLDANNILTVIVLALDSGVRAEVPVRPHALMSQHDARRIAARLGGVVPPTLDTDVPRIALHGAKLNSISPHHHPGGEERRAVKAAPTAWWRTAWFAARRMVARALGRAAFQAPALPTPPEQRTPDSGTTHMQNESETIENRIRSLLSADDRAFERLLRRASHRAPTASRAELLRQVLDELERDRR
ncbi:Chaperone protein DnaK [Sandaracinus amylolyticus]|uniref:Chaperone protein DnaK n=1 Tax=Sandaracinus amylolyticus TaxID=927083 RepID=A0A0F6YF95_9BACT|nr:Chaperone protein DnaK [Sandaracinus amylolyticus]